MSNPFSPAKVDVVSVTPVIRRTDLRKLIPLADTTIYEMEQRGEFPKRFYLTPRCPVWDLGEVKAWVSSKRDETESGKLTAMHPDVRTRRTRPVR